MKIKAIYINLALLFFVKVMFGQLPNLVNIEYYFDADPGFGQGNQIEFIQDSIVEHNFDVDLSLVSPGYHNLFMRLQDESGKWSLIHNQKILKADHLLSLEPSSKIVQAEYYFDTDPGFGLGVNIPLTPDSIINLSFDAELSPLTIGNHQLFVRVKDENGFWSQVQKQDIFKQDKPINSSGTVPQIVYLEYYFDADPGFGLGVNVPITADSIIDESFLADISPLGNGYHKLFVRVRDENGEWSLVNKQDIFKQDKPINSSGNVPHIVYMEYFFDTDPGFGLGINIPITADSIIDEHFDVDLSLVSVGYHKLFVRVKDENGQWSLINKQDIFKADHLTSSEPLPNIVQLEYYYDTDPGFGMGIQVAFNPDSIVDVALAPELNTLGLGNHKMFTRVKDENGRWSLAYTHAFTISLGADFKADLVLVAEDEEIHFTDLSTGAPTSWLWNFGDGETSTLQNPSHIYIDAGVYDVSLTVTSNGNTHSITKNDYIEVIAPEPEIAFSPASLNFGNVLIDEMESLQLTVSNTGNADLMIAEITYGNPFFAMFSGTIAPGSSQTIEVNFAPQAALFYEDVLVFHTSIGEVEFPVSGTGEPPLSCLQFDISAWDFGWTDILTGTTKNITITNCGTETLFVNGNFSGDAAFGFSPSNFTLKEGESQIVEISFNPDEIAWYSGMLHFSSVVGEKDIIFEGKGFYPSTPPQLTFAEITPFNGTSGVSPETGPSGSYFEYMVIYTDPDNDEPMNTYPKVGIDFNGDGDFLDPSESLTSMTEVDPADFNFMDGKIYSVISTLPKNSILGYRFFAFDALGNEASGEASVYKSGPTVSDDKLDLAIYANNITFSNATPEVGDEIVISATILNTSDYPAQNVPVSVYIENERVYETTLANVYAQSSAAISFNHIFAYADYYPVKVVIDEDNLLIEDNELNNFAIRSVLVGEVTLPGMIAVTSGLNGNQAYPFGTLRFFGHASYETTKFRGTNVSGAQVVMTIHETGTTFTGYTNANGDFNIYFTVPGTLGNYSVSATVTDFTLSATTTTHHFDVVPVINPEDPPPPQPTFQPDLVIYNWDINWLGDPVINIPNVISATFYNAGNFAAQDVTIFGYADGVKAFEESFANIPAAGSQTVSFETEFANTGNHSVTLVLDPLQMIDELVESNNSATKTRFYYPAQPDLTPIEMTFSDNSPLTNQEFSITAKIKNLNWIPSSPTTVAFYEGEDNLLGTLPVAGIAGGQTKTVTLAGQFLETSGWHSISVVVDSEDLVNEANELNQEIVGNIYIEQAMADLALTNIAASGYDPQVGDPMNFSVEISNNGSADAENFYAKFRIDGANIGDSILINYLGIGESLILTSESWEMTDGPHQVCITVDESNQIEELNEYNNQRCRAFGIDLQPSLNPYYAGNSASNRLNILVGEPLSLLARIMNNGNFRANEVVISYLKSAETLAADTISFINGGSFAESSALVQFDEPGDFTIQIVADNENSLSEINETNNLANLYIHVYENQPDLYLSPAMISVSNINPEQNEWVDISASWTNSGNEPSGAFTVQLYIDQTFVAETLAGNLDPGEQGNISWPEVFSTNQIGNHTIKIILDSENEVVEISENNNQASKNFIVGAAPDFVITAFSISDNDPETGEMMTISATVGNTGGAEASANLNFYYQTLNATILIGSEMVNLPKNGSTEIQASWFVQIEAGYIKAEIIGSNPPEANLSNNSAQLFFGGEMQIINPIADVVVDEDTPPFEVADLMQVFKNVDQSGLNFTVNCNEPNIHFQVTAGNKIEMSLVADWNGTGTAVVIAQNLYGQIALDTFEILVNPMPDYPDLSPLELSFGENTLYEGLPFGITVKVKNLNREIAAPTTVKFYEGNTNILGTLSLPALGSGQVISLTLDGIIFENPGDYLVKAVVDPDNLVEETDESNQEISESITVNETLPDLTPVKIVFSENPPYAGLPFDISVVVKNQSIFSSEPTSINIFDGNLLLGNLDLPEILGGQTDSIIFVAQIIAPSGWHTLKAVVDPDNIVDETNETNQELSKNSFIKQPLPDLMVFGISASNYNAATGDPINFMATISNNGNAAATNCWVKFRIDGSLLGDSILVNGLGIGQSQVVTSATWNMQNSPKNLCVVVDESNLIPELNELNNQSCRMFGVDLEPSKTPYYAGNSPVNRLNILKGETVQLFARAYNKGTFGINEAEVSFVINNQLIERDVIPFIGGGSYAEASVLHAFDQTGDFIIQIITDFENEVTETNETNNVVNLFITVYNDLPDLFIASEHIAPSSINPIQNEVIDVNATYFNRGNVPSGTFTVALYADDEFIVDTIVDSVEPGEEASVGWPDIYSTDIPGIHILKVVLDENGQLAEVNELNNVATRAIIVGDAPDFVLEDVILSRIYPAIGEPIEITANIQNNGDAGAEAVLSVYYITMNDTIQIYTGSFYVSKHGSKVKTVQWFAQVEEGYILTEITGSNPPEVNLGNNSLVRYFGDEIKVVNPIPDVEVYEDTPLYEVADLSPVFENVDQTSLTYTVETDDPSILLEIGAGNKLEMALAENWFGSTFAIITAHNIYNQKASDTLWITVNSYPAQHCIEIPKGWSGLSSWVLPHNPAIENVLLPVQDELIMLQTMYELYFPAQNLNTIGNCESQDAFKIKVTEACTLRISGFEEVNKNLTLETGWNLIPVISNLPVDPVELFDGNSANVKIVKDVAGSGVYWPEYGINSIGNLLPGKAYFVKMNVAGTVTFPSNDFTGFKTDNLANIVEEYSPWGFAASNPSSHIIAIPESLTTNFGDDFFIGAFTTEGIFAGACSIQKGQSQVLVVNADDPVTPEKDGFADGEPITFMIWNVQTGEETEVVVDFNPNQPDHSGLFAADGISAFSTLEILNIPTEEMLGDLQIFPNPALNEVSIITGFDQPAKVEIFDQLGSKCFEGSTSGAKTRFDISILKPGVFVVVIHHEKGNILKKLVVN